MINLVLISSSIRAKRLTHRVSLYLYSELNKNPAISTTLIDLAAHRFPPMEDVLTALPNPPESVLNILPIMEQADAFVFASPEYNGGYAPMLKNFLDYFGKSIYIRKAIGICTVSSGAMGGMRAALQLQLLSAALYAIPVPQMLLVPMAQNKFDEAGNLLEPSFASGAERFLSETIWYAEALQAKRLSQ